MKCRKCQSEDIEIRITNQQALNRTCSGMDLRINNAVRHKSYKCNECLFEWK